MAEAALKDESHESWEKFHHWICCICVVTFDLELGQALEVNLFTRTSFILSIPQYSPRYSPRYNLFASEYAFMLNYMYLRGYNT